MWDILRAIEAEALHRLSISLRIYRFIFVVIRRAVSLVIVN